MVECPICSKPVKSANINQHIDSECQTFIEDPSPERDQEDDDIPMSSFFTRPAASRAAVNVARKADARISADKSRSPTKKPNNENAARNKRPGESAVPSNITDVNAVDPVGGGLTPKRQKASNPFQNQLPLAARMRPQTLDEIVGQELVGPNGVLRELIMEARIPSMILWGGPGTGKTTIARVIASMVNSRFIEINSTNFGVGECKKIFSEARSEQKLTRRNTIIFCDEIHRFSKSQQEIFLEPVESGLITLIGATTENPAFKIQSTLLSRCRTFALKTLAVSDIESILERALELEYSTQSRPPILDAEMITYLATFAAGDARTALNILELTMSLATRPNITKEVIKKSMTQTLVYDHVGSSRFDTMSAFHKSIRGSNPDAALYYLGRMFESGEDPLWIARHIILIASDDIGIADNSLLPLATAAHSAVEKIGMPECRISLAHATVALARAKKSTSVFLGLASVLAALKEPGVSALPVPMHLRNVPGEMIDMEHGQDSNTGSEQEYLPGFLKGRKFFKEGR
ncbi:P-loop containing nucleoside triphosphate hydrolase protein [Hyaloscypha hepaticicola]|uniref:P-loop containing nucleoside triphosphate hydrolase protein n=1 Tax=Hyaloscypha hepaticicola TaxID=2082293 RepID=A0A2J6QLH6_9HELO|nr:P-loop containing nucleoside triphosphate hydrolase protein [Hyaloscypha hepaticicola]